MQLGRFYFNMSYYRKNSVGIVIAHYDTEGQIKTDLLNFVNHMANSYDNIVFVSTHLSVAAKNQLNPTIHVIVRENTGYDFYSYKIGLDYLKENKNILTVFLMNSSFCILDAEKLNSSFFAIDYSDIDLLGLTTSREIAYHAQSFLLRINNSLYTSSLFEVWWKKMKPLNNRDEVIKNYEIGMSQFFIDNGFIVNSLYQPSLKAQTLAIKKKPNLHKKIKDPLSLNPTHFYWEEVLDLYGIAKWELINTNPHQFNISHLQDKVKAITTIN